MQSPGYVVVRLEMIHEARVIPVDGRGQLDPAIKQWMGESRGHLEGNTLVVETTNFNGDRRHDERRHAGLAAGRYADDDEHEAHGAFHAHGRRHHSV